MFYFLGLFMILVVLVMVIGLTAFAKGGEFNKKYGNKMMRFRIAFQFLALVCAMALVYFAAKA